ncbi:hypothetical protein FM037_20555 [Shewanella psychropiezotolerans]|uniref:Uncharacterized protein n=1 Tax=Shewanella psychropiezotolerans TaxID=2593655 RepID=A0ABX5X1H3_9GAMM|nr:hypothetical protein [Shewanella psychropiezotolerans]QDO85190.1 hypothetical protein FM037_20555 [Shewanella psychropiezotolerans]
MNFKRVEIYFYAVLVLAMSMKFGVAFESLTLNFGVVTINNLTIPKSTLVVNGLTLVLGLACLVFNFKVVKTEQHTASQSHKKLIGYVNQKLQAVTGNTRDRVFQATLLGCSKPTVNTGAWTSYRAARVPVIIDIPFEILLAVKLESWTLAIIKSAHAWLVPILATISLIVVI